MPANSPAKSAPASRPGHSVPSRLNSGTPREAHHSHSSTVAPIMRIEACHIGGTSVTVVLMRICWRPQNAQHAMRRPMARESRWVLRWIIRGQSHSITVGKGGTAAEFIR